MGFFLSQVDAFSDKAFSGNPAAICILTEPANSTWMQNLAAEMNLSETAFLEKRDSIYNLRWFTPTAELELCGHATLAAAHTLWELEYLPLIEDAHFSTLSGSLHARFNEDWIELDFPSEAAVKIDTVEGIAKALKIPRTSIIYMGKNRFDYLVELDSEQLLKSLKPNLTALREFQVRGVVVTASSLSKDFDFVSRFFAPNIGIDEDPVTGSTHCCLGPYWADKLGKTNLIAYQASQRGGVVRVRVEKDRVFLSGKATTIFTGKLTQQALPIHPVTIK